MHDAHYTQNIYNISRTSGSGDRGLHTAYETNRWRWRWRPV